MPDFRGQALFRIILIWIKTLGDSAHQKADMAPALGPDTRENQKGRAWIITARHRSAQFQQPCLVKRRLLRARAIEHRSFSQGLIEAAHQCFGMRCLRLRFSDSEKGARFEQINTGLRPALESNKPQGIEERLLIIDGAGSCILPHLILERLNCCHVVRLPSAMCEKIIADYPYYIDKVSLRLQEPVRRKSQFCNAGWTDRGVKSERAVDRCMNRAVSRR